MSNRTLPIIISILVLFVLGSLYALEQAVRPVYNKSDSFSFRVLEPSDVALRGCVKNYSGRPCDHTAHFIAGDEISRADPSPLFKNFPVELPNTIWNGVSGDLRFRKTYAPRIICDQDHFDAMSDSILQQQPQNHSRWIYALSDANTRCIGFGYDGVNREGDLVATETSSLWFIDDNRVVGSITCKNKDAAPNPLCNVYSYPGQGRYRMTFAFFPAVNLDKLPAALPIWTKMLVDSLPKDAPADLVGYTIANDFVLSDAATELVARFRNELQ
jgi:hypothetical protein